MGIMTQADEDPDLIQMIQAHQEKGQDLMTTKQAVITKTPLMNMICPGKAQGLIPMVEKGLKVTSIAQMAMVLTNLAQGKNLHLTKMIQMILMQEKVQILMLVILIQD